MSNSPQNPEIVSMDVRQTPRKGPKFENQTREDLRVISPKRISKLKREEFVALTLEQISALTNAQIVAIKPSQIAAMDETEIAAFSGKQTAAFTAKQVASFTLDQIGALHPEQIAALLDARTVAAFDAEQMLRFRRRISELSILDLCTAIDPRPHPLSMWSEKPDTTSISGYTSWPSLTDRSFFGRHLPLATPAYQRKLPEDAPFECAHDHGDVTALFKREEFQGSRSSQLFTYFAQWFTDSFLRTDPKDRRRNTSNHQIDMCQIYGLDEATANILRSKRHGKLKVEKTMDEEYPPLLFDGSGEVKKEFAELPYVKNGSYKAFLNRFGDGEERKSHYFATGLERGNSNFGYTALSTLFLREHNRICDKLRKQKGSKRWSDERLFQTARMIVTLQEIKIVVEEYINHISAPKDGARNFVFDNTFAEQQHWYRMNWIAVEFDLLYRWHSLVPDTIRVGKKHYGPKEFLVNNEPLFRYGVAKVLRAATLQEAGRIGLGNTPDFLLRAEAAAIRMSRNCKLKSFNDYCAHFGLERKKSFAALTKDKDLRKKLKSLYKTVDNVEFLTGLYAEDPTNQKLFGDLMTTMVGCDAFSQALTNPLLSVNIFGKQTLTQVGMDELARTRSLQDVLDRNRQSTGSNGPISMDV